MLSLLGAKTGARKGTFGIDVFSSRRSDGIDRYPVAGRTFLSDSNSVIVLPKVEGADLVLEGGSVYQDLSSSPIGDLQKFSSTLL